MKKFYIVLSVAVCLLLLGGCTVNITVQDENGSSVPLPDGVESLVNDLISDNTTTTTTDSDQSSSESTTAGSTAANSSITTGTSATKTDKATSKTNPPSKKTTSVSKSTTSTTTSTTKAPSTTAKPKKDHGTPNINGTFHDNMANEVLAKLNAARKEAGLNELTMDKGNMMTAARIRAKEITVHWAHERPDKDRWDSVFDEEGVKYNARGENLADGHRTADEVFKAWMNSPGHKANIMEPRFTHISIVCLEHEGHFYWVQLFGANIKR